MADFYIGQIIQFGGNFAIRNMAMAAGQTMSISQNAALFSILGTTYGGNGQTTFALPDLRGRDMINWGQGLGLSNYAIGQVGGVEQISLSQPNMPSHTHVMNATLNASGSQPHASLVNPSAGAFLGHAVDISSGGKAAPAIYVPSGSVTSRVALGGLNVSAGLTGNNIPVAILAPYLAITQLVVLFGIFPSRN